MLRVVAKQFLKPGCKEAFLRDAAPLIQKSNEEEGCDFYDLWPLEGDENVVTFLEGWKDKAALDEHMKTDHFTQIFPRLEEQYLAKPSQVDIYIK